MERNERFFSPPTLQISAQNGRPAADHAAQECVLPRGQDVSADLRVRRPAEGPVRRGPAHSGPPSPPLRLHRPLPAHPDLLEAERSR